MLPSASVAQICLKESTDKEAISDLSQRLSDILKLLISGYTSN